MHLFKTSSFIFFTVLMVEGGTIARLDPEEVSSREKRDMFLDLGRDAVSTTEWRVLRGVAGGVGGGLSDTFTGNVDDVRFGSFGSWGDRAVGATGGLLAGQISDHQTADFKYGSSWAAGDSSNIFSGLSSQFLSSMSASSNSNENSKIQSNSNYPTRLFNLNQEGFGAKKFGFRDSAIGALLDVGSRNVISPLEHVDTTSNVIFSGEHLFNVAGNGDPNNVLSRVVDLFGKPILPDKLNTKEVIFGTALEHTAVDASTLITGGDHEVLAPGIVVVQAGQVDGFENKFDGKHLFGERVKLSDKHNTDDQIFEFGSDHVVDDASTPIVEGGHGVSTPEKIVAQTGQTAGSKNLSKGKHIDSEKLKLPDKHITDEHVIESGLEHAADDATALAFEIADGGYGVSAPEKVVAQIDGSDNLSDGKRLNSESLKIPDKRITDEQVIESGLEHEADGPTASVFEIADGGYGVNAPEKGVAQTDGSDNLSDEKHLNSESLKIPDKRITDQQVIESGLEHEADGATASAIEIVDGGQEVSAPENVVAQTGQAVDSEKLIFNGDELFGKTGGVASTSGNMVSPENIVADDNAVGQAGPNFISSGSSLVDRGHLFGQNQQVVGLPKKNIVDDGVLSSALEGYEVVAGDGQVSSSGHMVETEGGFIAGKTSNNLSAGSEHGLYSVAGGNSKIDAGQALKVLTSKNTTSSSNKSSKIKSSSSFGGSSSNLSLNEFGTSQLNNISTCTLLNSDTKLVYDSSGFHFGGNIGNNGLQHVYGQRNVGVNVVDQSNSKASIFDANILKFSRSISTDVEEPKTNSQSNSKSYNASNDSQYGALDQIYAHQNIGIDSSKFYIAF